MDDDDIDNDSDLDAGLDVDTAFEIASKVVDMCERVATLHSIVPGAIARWVLEVDGQRFAVAVTVE